MSGISAMTANRSAQGTGLTQSDPPAVQVPSQPEFRASQSQRQPVVVANKSAGKIQGFFERIAYNTHEWKKNRAESALNKSADKAGNEILNGLNHDNPRKVYQGLKRLNNATQKFGPKTDDFDEKDFLRKKCNNLSERISGDPKLVDKLTEYANRSEDYVNNHSDRHTWFHRMLTGLAKYGLVSDSSVKAREKRIKTLDAKIVTSLKSINAIFLEPKAKAGDPQAMFDLSICYEHGHGVEKNEEEGLNLLHQAHEAKHLPATRDLGNRYLDGDGVEKDEEKGINLLHQAAEAGDDRAKSDLNSATRFNDDLKIIELNLKVKARDPRAMCDLGDRYLYDGGGVEMDKKKGLQLFQQAVVAGDPPAMCELGDFYNSGRHGLKWDEAKAVELYQQAVEAKHPPGMRKLGICYLLSNTLKKDEEKGIDLLHQAIDARDTLAMYELGRIYLFGRGVEVDKEKGRALIQKFLNAGGKLPRFEKNDILRDMMPI